MVNSARFFNSTRWILVAVILAAFALRVYRLDYQSLRGDEAISAVYSARPLAQMAEISRLAEPHPPLFYATLHFWEAIAGQSEFSVRYLAALAGVLAIPALAALVRQTGGGRAATVAAVLLALNSFHWWHSQDARSYTALVCLGVIASALAWRAIRRADWRDWLVYALAIAGLLYLHYYAVFLIAFHGLFALWMLWRRRAKPAITLIGFGGAVIFAGIALWPWLRVSWQYVVSYTGNFSPASPLDILWRGAQAFGGAVVAGVPAFLPLTGGLIALALVGLGFAWRCNRDSAVFWGLYLGVTFAGVMILTLRGQAFTERYLLGALPAFTALSALGLAAMASRRGWGGLLAALALAALIGLNANTIRRYQTDPALAKSPEWRQAFTYLAGEINPATDALIYNLPDTSITYYLETRLPPEKLNVPVYLTPLEANSGPEVIARELAGITGQYRRVWLVQPEDTGWYDGRYVEMWLTRYADRRSAANFRWVRVDRYHTPTTVSAEMIAQPAAFAGGMQLRGFSVHNSQKEGAVQLEPGDTLKLSLYWQSTGPTAVPLTVFTQLIDPGGALQAGFDNQPVGNTYPTTAWQPGERITDQYRLKLAKSAPPGNYQLWVGLYDPATGARLPVLDEAGHPAADHVALDVLIKCK